MKIFQASKISLKNTRGSAVLCDLSPLIYNQITDLVFTKRNKEKDKDIFTYY